MSLLSFRDVTVSFGDAPVLDGASLGIFARERICLLGRNGAGKSTVLRLIAGEIRPDCGEIERVPRLRIAKLDQEVPLNCPGTVFDVAVQGLGAEAERLRAYHEAARALSLNPQDKSAQALLEQAHQALDLTNGWTFEQRIDSVLSKLGLAPSDTFEGLSGGGKRRALLAKALVVEPDILLLDEPTNHLDIPSIQWLEEFLLKLSCTLVFVTHDRAFLKKLATRIVDVDRGRLTSWDCDYERYLERKEALLESERVANAAFDKKLAQEEIWIRRGIEARRTRNEGRVRALQAMRRERAARREVQGKASLALHEGGASGQKVISVENISFCFPEGPSVLKDFTTTIWRGDRIGIVGPNGSGKTTFLRLLLGELKPQAGAVKHGTHLEIAYFDQHRSILDEALTLGENIAGDGDTVWIGGKHRHVVSYLREFLFSPQDVRAPVSRLSGGERARAVLAKLFLIPANMLVLDEPTNDLDVETSELLEELLLKFKGTVLMVSHDREFLKNAVNATFVLDGLGNVREYAGCDEADWGLSGFQVREEKAPEPVPERKTAARPRKLSNRERQDLESLPGRIEAMEAERAALAAEMAAPDFYRSANKSPKQAADALARLEADISAAYARWEELEALAAQLSGKNG